MTPKQKSFAKLAPPVDKITFADKIAGAKKEVDEMLGDVAAEAMKSALKGGQKKLDKNDNGRLDANDFAMLRAGKKHSVKEDDSSIRDDLAHEIQMILDSALGGLDQTDHIIDELGDIQQAVEQSGDSVAMQALQIMSSGIDEGAKKQIRLARKALSLLKGKQETDEGWDDMLKAGEERRHSGMKPGEKTQGHKGEIERTATGIRHTRRYDPKTGETDAGDDVPAQGEKRGRGRPKGSKAAIGAKGPSGKSKLMTRESSQQELDEAIARLEAAGYTVEKAPPGAKAERMVKHIKAGYADDGKITDRERGIAYATAWKAKKAGKVEEESDEQRDEKAEKAGRRVAKDIEYDEKVKDKIHGKKRGSEDDTAEKAGKKVTKDIEYDEKKKKVKEQGGAETPTASSGFSFGKGIYDSMNRELESMIAESMNISMNMNTDANGGPSRSLTVTATDDDALKLGALLKNAGLGGHDMGGAAEVEVHGAEDIADRIRQALGSEHGSEEVCADCGHADCECDHEEMSEAYGDTAVDENNPDFPSNTEYNTDALQYAGGLNKPKTDVAGDGQTTIPNTAVHTQSEDDLRRLREMAGVNRSNRLDEGLINKLKDFLVPKLMKLLGPDAESVANAVRQATGGDLTPSKENAMKVVQALGINKAAGQDQSQMAEGIAGNWQGKLIQSLYTLGLLGSAGAAMSLGGTVGGNFAGVIGILLLMFANTFFGEAPGQVGAMGKFGNKGTSAPQGLDIHGMPVRNMNVDESDDLARMMEMAGVKKKAVDEEKTDEGNKLTGGLADDDIKVGEKIPGTNVIKKKDIDEGILASTANLWKEYKGQYGV